MIQSIEVQNVRIFDDEFWKFPLTPATVVCGTNSSGKSTLLKVLLLLRQSMGIGENQKSDGGRLRFVGSQVDLGDYSTFVSHNDTKRQIRIALQIENHMPRQAASVLDSSIKADNEESKPRKKLPRVKYSLRTIFTFSILPIEHEDSDTENDSETGQYRDLPSIRGYLVSTEFELSFRGKMRLSWSVDSLKIDDDGDIIGDLHLPPEYVLKVPYLKDRLSDVEVSPDVVFRCALTGMLPSSYMIVRWRPKGDTDSKGMLAVFPIPEIISNVTRHLRESLESVDYLGPLRSPARRYYLGNFDAAPAFDSTGEFIPFILRNMERNKGKSVPSPEAPVKLMSFPDALKYWLHYLRTGDKISTLGDNEVDVAATKILVELRIRSALNNELHALIDSGFGYSQLLPILVKGLLMNPNSTLMIEQPELHLNPAVQVRLAEFFVALAKTKRQFLIETHSEHIVNTIRVLSAEDSSGQTSKLCRLYYIDSEQSQTRVHKLDVRPDGTVPDWPQGFFGEASSLAGRLLRAQKSLRSSANKKTTLEAGQ